MKRLSKEKCFDFIRKNRHALLLLYFLFYMPWFDYLEKTVTTHFHVIHTALDDVIPFCEYFIIPYFLWFAYVAWGVAYFLLKDRDGYFQLCKMLFTGMTVFLIVSTLYPNGHYLRPETFERDNLFVYLVRWLYATDTATNLFPSIHVYNSLAVTIAVWHCRNFRDRRAVRWGTAALAASIILSTMFLKQHSVFDVATAFLLSGFLYPLVYSSNAIPFSSKQNKYERNLHRV